MSRPASDISFMEIIPAITNNPMLVGEFLSISADGIPLVDFPGNKSGPLVARYLQHVELKIIGKSELPLSVLLCFENGRKDSPIILGILRSVINVISDTTNVLGLLDTHTIDKKSLNINVQEDLTLSCGKSSIALKNDGTVLIKGKRIISRAAETNKIKGGTVSIN